MASKSAQEASARHFQGTCRKTFKLDIDLRIVFLQSVTFPYNSIYTSCPSRMQSRILDLGIKPVMRRDVSKFSSCLPISLLSSMLASLLEDRI